MGSALKELSYAIVSRVFGQPRPLRLTVAQVACRGQVGLTR